MIGSRRKAEKLKADLRAEGMAKENLDALHFPAGLDIGAVTPDEIALSVLAEIVQDHRKADAGSKICNGPQDLTLHRVGAPSLKRSE